MQNDQKSMSVDKEMSMSITPRDTAKNTEIIKQKIPQILKNYEQLKEWSDLGQWLLKLQQVLQNHPCPTIPKKKLFCKRLAQCLSPVWPKAIHDNALVIYDTLLSNLTSCPDYKLVEDLPLFSLGLYPFFGYSSIQCKPHVLSIFEKYYYPLQKNLTPSIGGLIDSIIVGMEDTNEEMMKKVMYSLDKACESVGVTVFFGMLWTSILRSSRCRLGAFKYLMKRWNNQKQSQELEDQVDQQKLPNKSALVINALIASLEDEKALIKRAALDFMCAHAKIEDQIFSQQEYLLLVQSCLLLFVKLDHAVVRRINNWFFGEEEINEQMDIIKTIQEALRRIFSEDHIEPLKILQNWYMQHPETVGMTLQQIGFQLVKYIYQKTLEENGDKSDKVDKASERLVESIASNSELVLQSLYIQLESNIQHKKQDLIKETLNYLNFTINQLMKQQFSTSSQIEDYNQHKSRTICLQYFVQKVISGLIQVDPREFHEMIVSQQLLEFTLDCVEKIVSRFNLIYQQKEQNHEQNGQSFEDLVKPDDLEAINKYSEYYVRLNKFAVEKQIDNLFRLTSMILLKLQMFSLKVGIITYDEMPEWLSQLFQSMNGTFFQSICSIEIILEIIKQSSQSVNIQKLSQMIEHNSFKNIEVIAENLSLAKYQIGESFDGPNYIKAIFERLWTLIDHHDHKVIDFILYLSTNFNHVFTYVIEQSLLVDIDQRRYQIFCRQTITYYLKHPQTNNGAGVILMINYLDDENPLMRHNSRQWLAQSMNQFYRILDPLIGRLQDYQKIIKQEQDIIQKRQIALQIVDTIKKFKTLFQLNQSYTEYICNYKPNFGDDSTYLQLITRILVVYLTYDYENIQENSKINAISAELFEILLVNIESVKQKTDIITDYLETVLTKLSLVIQISDAVLQIQMLNLIMAMVQSTKEVQANLSNKDKENLMKIYQSNLFFLNLVTGLKQSNVFFLRNLYLQTILKGIQDISSFVDPKLLSEKVHMVLIDLLNLIKNHEFNSIKYVESKVTQRRPSYIDLVKNKKLIQEINQIEQVDQTKRISALGETYDELFCFITVVKRIIYYYFQFKDEVRQVQNNKQNVAGILLDFVTLSYLRSGNKTQQIPQIQIQFKYQDTCQLILQQMPMIITSYLECWKLGLDWSFLSTKGCIIYSFERFEEFNNQLKNLLTKKESDSSDDDQIKQTIIQIFQQQAQEFMVQLISSFLSIWQNSYSNNYYADPKQSQDMSKLLELAISLQIPPDEFINNFIKTPQILQIMAYYQKRGSKKDIYFFNYDQAQNENGLLFFLYVYFVTSCMSGIRQNQLQQLWLKFLHMTKALIASRHINTLLWIVEIFHLLSWKYSPREILANNELKKELHTQIRQIINILSEIAAQKGKFITINVNDENVRYSVAQNDHNLQVIVPFTPVVFEIYQKYVTSLQKNGEKTEELRDQYKIQRILFDPYKQRKNIKLSQEEFGENCALLSLKTIKKLAQITLKNTYEASRMERITEIIKEFMSNIFPLMEDKTKPLIVEGSSELLKYLLKKSKEPLANEFRKQILDIFYSVDFFRCQRRTLQYWKNIIDWIADKGDLLQEQLGNNQNFLVQGLSNLFQSKSAEIYKKINGFARICFIIYSGGVDKYTQKITNLIDSILIMIKDVKNQDPTVMLLIIFCLRILILRLSPESLNQLFRKIWPSIISMLMQIFDKRRYNQHPQVLQAGLKLVELFSLYQLEEFYFYQWIFVFDYFGITVKITPKAQDQIVQGSIEIITPFEYTPCIPGHFPNQSSYEIDYENHLYQDQMQVSLAKKKRQIIMREQKIEDEQEVRRNAVFLCQNLIDINQQRVEVSPQQLESQIENEFTTLDELIIK
ncbi:hypothetical protein pb186bvf_005733 [Paramecium bursaria]